ncbi:MAG: ABC transporter permease [Paracoccaceae bacterium]
MFQQSRTTNTSASGFAMVELIYHATVRHVRKDHANALVGLFMNILQTITFVAAFYVMFSVLGLRGSAVRGDFLLFLMSGIFLFICHTKSMGAIVAVEGPGGAMMKHAPMNSLVMIASAALSALYTQILSMAVVLFLYHVLMTPVVIEQPLPAMWMLILSWLSGVGVGVVLLSIKPWFPGFVGIASQVYARANMIASGKMFLANTMPGYLVAMFKWNPLFHTIDQARGFTFINYNPHYSSATYPLIVAVVLIVLGLMGESYTRKHASASWMAAR